MIQAVIINDPRRRDRWDKTMQTLGRFSSLLDFKQSPAVFADRTRAKWGATVTAPECGCAMAHRTAWVNYLASGRTEPLVVFEDDIVASAHPDIVAGYLSQEYMLLSEGKKDISHLGWFGIPGVGKYLGAHAYMINQTGARKLLRRIPAVCPPLSFDIIVSHMVERGELVGGPSPNLAGPTKGIHRGVFLPDVHGSTIGYLKRGINSVVLHLRHIFNI